MKKSEARLTAEARDRIAIVLTRADEFIQASAGVYPAHLEETVSANRELLSSSVSDERVRRGAEAHAYEQVRLAQMALERTIEVALTGLKQG